VKYRASLPVVRSTLGTFTLLCTTGVSESNGRGRPACSRCRSESGGRDSPAAEALAKDLRWHALYNHARHRSLQVIDRVAHHHINVAAGPL
jgi:hypothetical protein